jgi:hypothetical protein
LYLLSFIQEQRELESTLRVLVDVQREKDLLFDQLQKLKEEKIIKLKEKNKIIELREKVAFVFPSAS